MAAQVIALTAPSGLSTPTLRVFADGSDTQVSGSPFTLTEATNRKGYYSVSFTGTLSGLHLTVLYSGSSPVGSGWVSLQNVDGTFVVNGDRNLDALVSSRSTFAGGAVASVTGDVGGKVLGGGAGTITGVGVRAVDGSGNAIAPAATALSNATWTDTRAGKLDNLDALVSSRSTLDANGVWNHGTRTLTAFAFTVGTTDSASIVAIKAKTDNLPSVPAAKSDIPTAIQNATAVRSELTTELGRIDVTISTRLAATSYTAPLDAAGVRGAVGLTAANLDSQFDAIPTAAENATAVRAELGTELGRIDATISSRLAGAAYTTPPTVTAIRTELDTNSTKLVNLDATVSSRLASGSYVVPPTVTAIRTEIDTNSTKLASISTTTSKLDLMIESNGSGDWRFDTVALSMAPAGGGGGGGGSLTAQQVWEYSSRTLTSLVPTVPPGSPPPPPSTGSWNAAGFYCTIEEFLIRYDKRRVAELLLDEGLPASGTDLNASPVLEVLLDDASSMIRAAATVSHRYTPADLATFSSQLGHPSRGVLLRLTADLTFGLLVKRRGYDAAAVANSCPGYVEALQYLELLRRGERIFPSESHALAGAPSTTQFPAPPNTPSLFTTNHRIFPGF